MTTHARGAAAYLGPANAPGPVRVLARVSQGLAALEGVGIGVFLASLILLATWQFVARNLRSFGVDPAPIWIDAIIRHAVFFIGFLGGAFATQVIKHLRVDAISRLLPWRKRLVVRIVTTIFACVMCLLLLKAGWAFYQDIALNEGGDVSHEGELITPARGAMAMPVGFALILFHFITQIVVDLAWLRSEDEPPPEWMSEAH